jgi:uncharacterized protein (DUF305 family)
LAALAFLGCGGGPGVVQPSPQPAAEPQGEVAATTAARADSARNPYTEADIHFMSAMISHHAQAIVMAGWADTHDASPAVRILAGRIINAQQDEIGLMQRWLRERGLPVPEASPTGMKMKMNGVEHEMLMPGMLTPDQMEQLNKARGADFDWIFVTSMIQHHRGAVDMVKELFGTTGAAQDDAVFKLASDVHVDQITEIDRMVKLLASLPSGARSP